jgi:hypothetical protein
MTQADKRLKSAILETYESGIEEVANLVAAYRSANENYSTIAARDAGQCMSVGVELQVLQQLAQFDKLLIALR